MKKENFMLTTLKVLKNKVIMSYYNSTNPKEVFNNVENKEKPHPDLKESLLSLSEVYKKVFAFNESHEVDITGINQTTGKGGTQVQILGMLTSVQGVCSLNTKAINTDNDIYGIEDDINIAMEIIEEEVYKYKFLNKRQQLEMDFDESQSEEEVPAGVDAE